VIGHLRREEKVPLTCEAKSGMTLLGPSRKEVSTLSQTDRERYGVACTYIQRRLDELGVLRARTDEINDSIFTTLKSCVQVMKHVDEANAQYTKLQTALGRFQRLTQSIEGLTGETTAAWNKLHEAEQKILENPAYAGLKSGADTAPPADT
jgi:hypothetical protein